MLHVCTPLFRFDNIQKVYDSLLDKKNITWHVSYSSKREKPNVKESKKINVIFYPIECEEKETYKKRNVIFENIHDGYFSLLDDDTMFHPNMFIHYEKLKKIKYNGMLIGQQISKDGKVRLKANMPVSCYIDTGNVLCHYSCLKTCKWPEKTIGCYNRDFLFWKSVFIFYQNTMQLVQEPISYYNKLR